MREFLLGDQLLEECVEHCIDKGRSIERITDFVNAWILRTVAYVIYLTLEGYSAEDLCCLML